MIANALRGLVWGGIMATACAVFAFGGSIGQGGLRADGLSLLNLVILYYAVGAVGGLFVGLLLPIMKYWPVAGFVGALIVGFFYSLVDLARGPVYFDRYYLLETGGLALVVGGGCGVAAWLAFRDVVH